MNHMYPGSRVSWMDPDSITARIVLYRLCEENQEVCERVLEIFEEIMSIDHDDSEWGGSFDDSPTGDSFDRSAQAALVHGHLVELEQFSFNVLDMEPFGFQISEEFSDGEFEDTESSDIEMDDVVDNPREDYAVQSYGVIPQVVDGVLRTDVFSALGLPWEREPTNEYVTDSSEDDSEDDTAVQRPSSFDWGNGS